MLLKEKQEELQDEVLIDKNNNLTSKGIEYNKAFYDLAVKYGMICRCNINV